MTSSASLSLSSPSHASSSSEWIDINRREHLLHMRPSLSQATSELKTIVTGTKDALERSALQPPTYIVYPITLLHSTDVAGERRRRGGATRAAQRFSRLPPCVCLLSWIVHYRSICRSIDLSIYRSIDHSTVVGVIVESWIDEGVTKGG